MKSHELAKLLLENPDVTLIMSKDREGNKFTPLSGVDYNIIYLPGGEYTDVYDVSESAEDVDMDEDEWEKIKKQRSNKHAILYPRY